MILQDPDKEILRKCPHNRDLVQVLLQDPDTSGPKDPHTEILKHRSCTSCPTGSWYSCPTGDLAQVVVQDPDTSGPKDPDTEILYKWSYRILIQVVQKDPHTEILSCTSANKWCKRILMRRSCYKCRANLPSLLVGVRSHTLFGVSCRDNMVSCLQI